MTMQQSLTITNYFKRAREEESAINVKEKSLSTRNREFLRGHFPKRDNRFNVFYDLLDALNARQLLALTELPRENNLFVTGCAGTGKTLWMRAAIALLQGLNKNVAVTATTALAASNINVLPVEDIPNFQKRRHLQQTGAAKKARLDKMKPTKMITFDVPRNYFVDQADQNSRKRVQFDITPRTLHSWAGIGIDKFDPIALATDIRTKKTNFFEKARKRWQYTDVLFMDEVSMLDPVLFAALDVMGREIRMDGRPFGGIQLVIVADFFQLPPILKNRQQQQHQRQAILQTEDTFSNRDQDNNDEKVIDEEEEKHSIDFLDAQEHEIQLARRTRDLQRSQSVTTLTSASKKAERDLLLAPVAPENAQCCFQTMLWKESIKSAVVFDEIFRQNNPIFIDILAELRRGVVSRKNIALLAARTRSRLTTDLMQIAQQLFGNRNCDYLRAMSKKLFDAMKISSFSKETPEKIFQQCEIDVTENFSAIALNSFVVDPPLVRANWDRMLKYVRQCCAQTEFDVETALIYCLPLEHVPASHTIIVSEIEPTNIMSLNDQVERCNEAKLAAIKAPLLSFSAGISIDLNMQSHYFREAQEYFMNEFKKNLTPLHLRLKVGAQVLLTSNLAPRFYNGRRGVVLDFLNLEEYQKKYGQDALLLPKSQSSSDDEVYPVVLFDNGSIVRIGRHEWERKRAFGNNPKLVYASLTQFPLMLAFAITIHKSQGMTIERLSVNLTSAFESGLPYVALSRGINLESIVIEHMDESIFDGSQAKFLPPPFVVAFYEQLDEEMASFEILKQ